MKMYRMKMAGVSGAGYFMYRDGILRTLYYEFEEALQLYLPQREQDIADRAKFWNDHGVTFVELVPKTVEEKLALFCAIFKEKRKAGYTPKQNEKNNLKVVMVTDKLLHTYFDNQAFPLSFAKSITDYIRHYNHIRVLEKTTQGVGQCPPKYPDRPDNDYEKRLDGPNLSAFREHLYKIGWRFNKDNATWYNIHEKR